MEVNNEEIFAAVESGRSDRLVLLLAQAQAQKWEYRRLFEESVQKELPLLAECLVREKHVTLEHYDLVGAKDGEWVVAICYEVAIGGHSGYCSDPGDISDDEPDLYFQCEGLKEDPSVEAEGSQELIDAYSREHSLSSYSRCFGGQEMRGIYDENGEPCESKTYYPLHAISFRL